MAKHPFETSVVDPYCLVEHEGKLRLAFCIRFLGEGFPVGSINGYRVHLLTDSGMVEDTEESVVIKPVNFVRDWGRRPTFQQLEAARAKAVAERV